MLAQLAAVHESIVARGGDVIGMAPASARQAERLMSTSIPFELFIDPGQMVSARVGVGKQSLSHFVLSLSSWWRYLIAFFSGHWQHRITGHYSNLPGVVVVEADGTVVYIHRGTGLGDYPPLDSVVDELDNLLSK